MTNPGERSRADQRARMVRVNHAGEYGAARIYDGQLSVLKDKPCGPLIQEMRDQEQMHLDAFNRLVVENRVRPTVLTPLWHVGGYVLGAVCARLGERAAMACTVAVEEVIDDHYAAQEKVLEADSDGQDLRVLIAQFRADEAAHRDHGLASGAMDAPGYPLLKAGIKAITRSAIWLSTRI